MEAFVIWTCFHFTVIQGDHILKTLIICENGVRHNLVITVTTLHAYKYIVTVFTKSG